MDYFGVMASSTADTCDSLESWSGTDSDLENDSVFLDFCCLDNEDQQSTDAQR